MQAHDTFRELCRKHDLAATHQRWIIYHAATAKPGHRSPEQVYDIVRRQIPSISLATVYKNLHTFVASGMLREVSPHHGVFRVDSNSEAHHHLVCTRCRAIEDIPQSDFHPVRLKRSLPKGFAAREISIEIHGLCSNCQR